VAPSFFGSGLDEQATSVMAAHTATTAHNAVGEPAALSAGTVMCAAHAWPTF
jgi:hypothetical protein